MYAEHTPNNADFFRGITRSKLKRINHTLRFDIIEIIIRLP